MRLAGGSPQADLRPGRLPIDFSMEPERKPPRTSTGVPNRNPLQTQGLPTSRITTREAPHKQNYDQGAYVPTSIITPRQPMHPQSELRPGSRLAGWLAGWWNYDQGTYHALGWLAGWLAGGLASWQCLLPLLTLFTRTDCRAVCN